MPVPAKQLVDIPVFLGLTTVELEELATAMEIDEAPLGRKIITEGDDPDHPIYVLLEGSVEIVMHGFDGRDHVISTLSAPSVFGEIEVLAKRDAIASVQSTSAVKLALLRRGDFDQLCNADRLCILKVLKNISRILAFRLAATDRRMAAYFSSTSKTQPLGEMRTVMFCGQQDSPER